MTQSITLTASMRSNLASLKTIQGQMDTTQTRLSTGKKVNSAIDNASSYYQSRSLNNRAADLDNLLDSMGQGIQTIQAANEGIEAVTSYIEQAKSVANSAYALDASADDYMVQVHNCQEQFNAIISEIGTLAQDSSYQGVNLLTGSKLTVMFNETRTHYLDVQGKDIVGDMAGLGFTNASWGANVSWTADANGKYNTLTGALLSDATTSAVATHFSTATAVSGDKYKINSAGDGFEVDNATGTYYKFSAEKADGTVEDVYATAVDTTAKKSRSGVA